MKKDLKDLSNQHLFCENIMHELIQDLRSFDHECTPSTIISNNITDTSNMSNNNVNANLNIHAASNNVSF